MLFKYYKRTFSFLQRFFDSEKATGSPCLWHFLTCTIYQKRFATVYPRRRKTIQNPLFSHFWKHAIMEAKYRENNEKGYWMYTKLSLSKLLGNLRMMNKHLTTGTTGNANHPIRIGVWEIWKRLVCNKCRFPLSKFPHEYSKTKRRKSRKRGLL